MWTKPEKSAWWIYIVVIVLGTSYGFIIWIQRPVKRLQQLSKESDLQFEVFIVYKLEKNEGGAGGKGLVPRITRRLETQDVDWSSSLPTRSSFLWPTYPLLRYVIKVQVGHGTCFCPVESGNDDGMAYLWCCTVYLVVATFLLHKRYSLGNSSILLHKINEVLAVKIFGTMIFLVPFWLQVHSNASS